MTALNPTTLGEMLDDDADDLLYELEATGHVTWDIEPVSVQSVVPHRECGRPWWLGVNDTASGYRYSCGCFTVELTAAEVGDLVLAELQHIAPPTADEVTAAKAVTAAKPVERVFGLKAQQTWLRIVLADTSLHPRAKVMAAVLFDVMGRKSGITWHGVPSLVSRSGMSASTAKRGMADLVAQGYVGAQRRYDQSTVRWLRLPDGTPAEGWGHR